MSTAGKLQDKWREQLICWEIWRNDERRRENWRIGELEIGEVGLEK